MMGESPTRPNFLLVMPPVEGPADAFSGDVAAVDRPVLLPLVDRMKEAKAAPVLAAMLPDKARDLTAKNALEAHWRESAEMIRRYVAA